MLYLLLALCAQAQDVDKGRLLAGLGGCIACHTADDGPQWAGGHAIETEFGTFYGSNITPDPETGIGAWSEDDFVRAMVRGKSPGGKAYWPAFPYTSFTAMHEGDLRDLWAFLQTLEPVARDNQPHQVHKAYRSKLGLWRSFVFRRWRFKPSRKASDEVNRGDYLANTIAHCGECHTGRSKFGKLQKKRWFAGSGGEPEPAPNITPHPDGIEGWRKGDLVDLLEYGMKPNGDFVGKGMGRLVEHGTSQITADDRAAIAAYLMSLPALPSE